ncbi:MAG: uncharacterized protein QOG38_855, partial [Hyphomicrobiales bacterium]|nr:uncharacterized protein [Hyphomicrobiales bacterium]
MTLLRAILVASLASCLSASSVSAQPMQIVPPAAQTKPPAPVMHTAPEKKAPKRPTAKRPDAPAVVKTEPVTPPPVDPAQNQTTALRPSLPATGPQPDIAFGAYQRGEYLAAFKEASRRASEQGDPVAMTLIGDLYANGYGVPKDEKK